MAIWFLRDKAHSNFKNFACCTFSGFKNKKILDSPCNQFLFTRRNFIMKNTINRGDVFYANLKSDGTSRQSGIRPIIVISNPQCNRHSPIITILTCTTSRTKHPLPTHISLPASETGMKYDSICLCEQPMSIAKTDLLEFVTSLSDEHMEKVNDGLRCQLCL